MGVLVQAASSGPILSFGPTLDNSQAAPSASDRVWYIGSNGNLRYAQGNPSAPQIGTSGYDFRDNQWHHVYLQVYSFYGSAVTNYLYIDGGDNAGVSAQSKRYTASFGPPPTSPRGYWRVGWHPMSATAYAPTVPNYFKGSVSHISIWDDIGAPTAPPTADNLSLDGKYDSWSSSNADSNQGTHQWGTDLFPANSTMGDIGYTPTQVCAMDNIAWSTANPSATVLSSQVLGTWAAGAAWSSAIAAPGPGAAQTSTITLTRNGTFHPNAAGLHLRVPMAHRVNVPKSTASWSLNFDWSDQRATFYA